VQALENKDILPISYQALCMMAKFNKNQTLAFLFIAPQLLVTVIFFIWPALEALAQSFFYTDAFGIQRHFAGGAHYWSLLTDGDYLKAIGTTGLIALALTLLTMGFGVMLAYLILARTKSQWFYKTLMIWPYAIAPAVGAILWRFLCHPTLGWLTHMLKSVGIEFNYLTQTWSALAVIILVGSWQQFSYNFIFYIAALNAIPKSLKEAARLDGANAWQLFWQILWPLLSPTTFFLLVMNIIYAFFETFGIIHVLTQGGPGKATTTLMYKVYEDGFLGMDFGIAAAQSVLLMLIVMGLTRIQFKYLDNKVHYQ
jgi:sn-glycerol 3-phosphate transport system permease protein